MRGKGKSETRYGSFFGKDTKTSARDRGGINHVQWQKGKQKRWPAQSSRYGEKAAERTWPERQRKTLLGHEVGRKLGNLSVDQVLTVGDGLRRGWHWQGVKKSKKK